MDAKIIFPVADRPRRALISLTPLIDVVFILLVFFMLVSSFVHQAALPLSTPIESRTATSVESPPLQVILRTPGRVELNGNDYALDDLSLALSAALADHPTRAVTLRVRDSVSVQATVAALDILRAVGPDILNLRRLEE
ncbi:MAG: ExbD/TolR family protein [Thioalkalivibrionaceae bacterium]